MLLNWVPVVREQTGEEKINVFIISSDKRCDSREVRE